MSNRFTPAALAALSIAFASVGAQAQEAPYCDGRIVARIFRGDLQGSESTINGNNTSSYLVTYWVRLQNTTSAPMSVTVSFDQRRQLQPRVTEAQSGSPVSLAANQQIRITLGKQTFNGSDYVRGSLIRRPQEIRNYTEVTCPR